MGNLTRLAAAVALGLLVCAVTARADDFDGRQRAEIQEALIWAGGYDGMVDGESGEGTVAAIRNFQGVNGYDDDGELTHRQAAHLRQSAEAERKRLGYMVVADERAGVSVGIPPALVTGRRATKNGNTYSSTDGKIEIDTLAFDERDGGFDALFDRISRRGPITNVGYTMKRENKFVVSGDDGAKHHYFMALRSGGTIRAMSIFAFGLDLCPITVAAANHFRIGASGVAFAEPRQRELDLNSQEVVHSVRNREAEVAIHQLHPGDRMNVHKNARLTPKGREAMARAVVMAGLTNAAAARAFNTTPSRHDRQRFLVRPSRLMGGNWPRLACGRCQL